MIDLVTLMILSSSFSIIYVDGCRMERGVGAAFTVNYKFQLLFYHRIRLGKINLIYQDELLGILHAID